MALQRELPGRQRGNRGLDRGRVGYHRKHNFTAAAIWELPIGRGQTISRPLTHARYLEALELNGHERVLEVGTGSGYQAALLSQLVAQVFTVERLAIFLFCSMMLLTFTPAC